MAAVLEVRSLSKVYQGRGGHVRRVVEDVTFAVQRGEVYGLLGPAHAGKTLTLRMVAGRVRPTAGRVLLEVRGLTAGGCAAGDRRHVPLSGARDLHALDSVSSPIVLLDDPTRDLDAAERQQFDRAMDRIAGHETAVLLATRSLAVATGLCSRVALLDRGRMLAELGADELPMLARRELYHIRVGGCLETHWSDWLGGLRMTYAGDEADETVLTGSLADQGALHGVLRALRDLAVPLLALQRIEVGFDP